MDCGKGRVLVVDDDAAFRVFVAETLASAGFGAVEAGTGTAALEVARAEQPVVVVLDVNLTDLSGFEVCRRLRDEFGQRVGVMFLSGSRIEATDRAAGLLLGADDYLVKPLDRGELVARVLRLAERVAGVASPLPTADFDELTPREREILTLLAEGLDQGEIASRLFISPKTVATHIQRILRKLNVHSRAQAVAAALHLFVLT